MTTRLLSCLLYTLLLPAAASAQELGTEPVAPPEEPLSHAGQVGIRVGFGVPYIFAVKYGEGPRCDATGEEFCHRLGSALIDLEIGVGLSETVELSGLARFGLAEDEASNAVPLAFGFGARAYTSPSAQVKGFLGGRAMIDITSSDVPEWKTVDLGVRGELGIQFDLVRYVGFYAQAGASIMLLRALNLAFDGTVGVQVRFP